MRVLFWNTYKNENINSILSDLIIENDISIVVLAEYVAESQQLISMLLEKGKRMTQYITSGCDRIHVFGTIKNVEPANQMSHASMQIINEKDILCCVHLNCKQQSGHVGFREVLMDTIIRDLQELEKAVGTENSIIVGDFNINPYDSSCVDARYFHGIPVLAEAERKTRVVAGREYPMFYNPMWNLLGDFEPPYGTYYYNNAETENTYWNMFDQVIFKPVLKDRFVKASLKIITETSKNLLLNKKGHPNKKISDHLPIMFEFEEESSHD